MKKQVRPFVLYLSVALLLLLIFWRLFPPFYDGWIGDDYPQLGYVYPYLKRPFAALTFYDPTWISWYYRPNQNVWFLLLRRTFGLNPLPFYTLQLGIHLLTVALIYRLGRRLGYGHWFCWGWAALFGLHGHFVDVVTWISAIAIVLNGLFSVLGVWLLLTYWKRPSWKRMGSIVAVCLLALLTHEEALLLPPFLGLILLLQTRSAKNRRLRPEAWVGAGLCAVAMLGYLWAQSTRATDTISLETTLTQSAALFDPAQWGNFILVTGVRLTQLYEVVPIGARINTAVFLVTLFIISAIYWEGQWSTRLALLWFMGHLALIYVALYSQRPEFYSGRHLYVAWLGGSFLLARLFWLIPEQIKWPRGEKRPFWLRLALIIPLALCALTLLHFSQQLTEAQLVWETKVNREKEAEAQLKSQLTSLSPNAHPFAYRFPITPAFLRSVLHVWYDTPLPPPPSGPFSALEAGDEVPVNSLFIDYANDTVILLPTPDPQPGEALWRQPPLADPNASAPRLSVAGPTNDRRLTLPVSPPATSTTWGVLTYRLLLEDAVTTLYVSTWMEPGLHYRVRITPLGGETAVLWEAVATGETAVWQPLQLPLPGAPGMVVDLSLEAQFTGETEPPLAHWATPYVGR